MNNLIGKLPIIPLAILMMLTIIKIADIHASIYFEKKTAENGFSNLTVEKKPPNIVLILSDDMGFSDIGCFGGEIITPNLNALAQEGLRFTQFYNCARCCPTRASLLTGLYPHQAGIGHMTNRRDNNAYRGDLSRSAVTIAEVLKMTGYSTYMAGKWHLTPFKMYKHWVQEGGIATPLILSWPSAITAGNRICETPSHVIDIMATLLDVTGASYPAIYKEHKIKPFEGLSLRPVLEDKNGSLNTDRPLYFEHEGNRAIRLGEWKLVSKPTEHPRERININELPLSEWELFNMENDRTELNDLSDKHPEIAEKLAGMWLEWAKQVKAVPVPFYNNLR